MWYTGKLGNTIGQEDDEIPILADSSDAALEEMLEYAESGWPDSDGEYDAVCWIEDGDRELCVSQDVTITADGDAVRGPRRLGHRELNQHG
tara:strand:+ start:15764 stop:16036 length:273 start_codon:yes stop_codon:yes gene_type:complete